MSAPLCTECGKENPRESWPSCQRDKYDEKLCYQCYQKKQQKKCNKCSGGGCCGARKQQEDAKEAEPPSIASGGAMVGVDVQLHMDDVKKTVLQLCGKVGVGPVGLTAVFP